MQQQVEIRKKPGRNPGLIVSRAVNALIVHTAHATHTTARHAGGPTFLLRPFGDHGFRDDQKPGDRRKPEAE